MSHPQYLRGRHAIVTGGGSGIGAAIAEELARLGADITLMGRRRAPIEDRSKTLAQEFSAKVFAIECDVSDGASIAKAFALAQRDLGAAYVLVNNAGEAVGGSFVEMSREIWDRMLSVNLTGSALCAQQVLPAMIKAKAGRIINIASTAGLKGYSHVSAYCAAKHGVVGFTRALAMETAKLGITVNAVCPGYTETDMTRNAIRNLAASLGKSEQEAASMLLRNIPRGKFIQPAEVASIVGWLCSEAAAAVSGQAIPISGGEFV